MSGAAGTTNPGAIPEFKQVMGHPRPLWMLFMTEFWERFAFYGIRWALTLYIVQQFYDGSGEGQAPASRVYGAYLALVYAAAIFGGYIADRVIGYQRSILLGAVVMAAGLFMIAWPDETVFKLGLATVIAGNGLFKPNISTMVGKLYAQGDERRDSGFTLFYMGINLGAMFAPLLTGWMAENMFGGSPEMPTYKIVFITSGIGMLISLVWFWFGRRQLGEIGRPMADEGGKLRVLYVLLFCLVSVPVYYFLLAIDAGTLQIVLTALFLLLCGMLLVEGIRDGKVARDRAIAMLIIFTFNILFWCFFEQAGSSFNFLAEQIVNRDFGGWIFPVGWFQSVNSLAIITLAPLVAWTWIKMGRNNPSIPRKFGIGIIFNGLAFLLLMAALSGMVVAGKIPFWTLFMVYVIQSVGELCLSPIGLSMTTKLAPVRLVGFGMGGWFLSTGIGNNLSGIFASHASYTQGFIILMVGGVLLFLVAPLIQRLMHGVK
ncbi:MAG: MFS transporter [Lysobacteraceae bacterium]|nr:MAG: MFS transporter [Xanthomonadaceae bacterium]